MTYEFIPSQLNDALIPVPFLLLFLALFATCRGLNVERPALSWILYGFAIVLICAFIGTIAWGFNIRDQEHSQDNAKFSQQLMDEYHVKSSLPLSDINLAVKDHDNAETVFTAPDGTKTAVLVKVINRTDHNLTMTFNVLNTTTFYPKPDKQFTLR